MRIAHVCLSCFYIDGRSYQENELVRQHVLDGHEVLVIASTETHTEQGLIGYTKPGEYLGSDGVRVARLPYRRILPHGVMTKLRMHSGTYSALEAFRPEVVLFHGTCGWELMTAARYCSMAGVDLFIDSHEDWNNSARGFISRELLHRRYYGPILRSVLPVVKKILCISTESIEFVHELYRVPREQLEFFPLGGHILSDHDYQERRRLTREKHELNAEEILLLQSGKQTRRKKLIESLRSFRKCTNPTMRLFIAGVLHEDIRTEATELIASDRRVSFLGWKSAEELTDLLCAADIYLQPGTQSVTMQHSLCARCAVVLADAPAHRFYHRNNGWLINNQTQLHDVFNEIGTADIAAMQRASHSLASKTLDYAILSKRVLPQGCNND